MKLMTPYGLSDYIPGGILTINRTSWKMIIDPDPEIECYSCEDYDIASYTDSVTGRKFWFYREEQK